MNRGVSPTVFGKALQRRRVFRERFAVAEARRQGDVDQDFRHDPIEDDPQVQPLLAEAEALATAELSREPRGMGFCHTFWRTKQRILEQRFGITWFSPGDMNPDVDFD